MKKLFTIKHKGLPHVEVEGAIYSLFDFSSNKTTFIDAECNVLEDYSRPDIQYDEPDAGMDDPDFFIDIGEDFYTYTTHEVTYDVDGNYGLFGIKYGNGEKITEEIFHQVGGFWGGLCAVANEDGKWGCIDTKGNLVLPYRFCEPMEFNEYGIAIGDDTLIDISGKEIPDTALNLIGDCGGYSRYFVFSLLNDEQLTSIDECGTASDITVNIYDTKNLAYVIKDIPDHQLDTYSFEGEPEVIIAAAEMIDNYDEIHLSGKGTIICEKNNSVTVYDYYL